MPYVVNLIPPNLTLSQINDRNQNTYEKMDL